MKAKKKTHVLRDVILIMLLCVVIGLVLTWVIMKKEGNRTYASSNVSFTFDKAAQGVAPNGYRFNANDLLREEVVSKGLEAAGMADRYAVEDVQKNLSVRGVYPNDLISQLTTHNSLTDANTSQQLINSNYHPTTFSVTLYHDFDSDLSEEELKRLLESILTAYKEYFATVYAMGDIDEVEIEELQDLDYFQQLDTLEVDLNQAAVYSSEMAGKEPTLQINGKGFSDISLQFEKRVQNEISALNATMTMNSLSKDLDRLYAMYEFQTRELQNQIDIQNQCLENLDELIATYGKTGIIYLGTSDSLNRVDYQSSGAYDKLVDERNVVSEQIATLNNRLETVQKKLDRLQTNLDAAEEDFNQAGETEKETETEAVEESETETEPIIKDEVLDQADATLAAVDEAVGTADLSEAGSRQNTVILESGINRLAGKGNEAIDSLSELLHAYNEQEINDLTVRSSAVRYSNPMRSTALVKKAIKVTGAVCVIGLILSLLILIIVNLRERKTGNR